MTAVHIWESESVLNIAGLKIYASPLQHHSLCEREREWNANSCCHGDMNLMRIKNEINEEFALAWRCCLSVCPRGLSACSVCGCGHGQRGKHAFKTLLARASRKKTQISSPHHWHTKTEVEISKCVCSNAELVGRERVGEFQPLEESDFTAKGPDCVIWSTVSASPCLRPVKQMWSISLPVSPTLKTPRHRLTTVLFPVLTNTSV